MIFAANINPAHALALLAGAMLAGVALIWCARLRPDFPSLVFVAIMILLSGAGSIEPLREKCQAYLRWVALFVMVASSIVYLQRGLSNWTPLHFGFILFLIFACCSIIWSDYRRFSLLRAVSVAWIFTAAFIAVWGYIRDERHIYLLMTMCYRVVSIIMPLGFLFLAIMPGEVFRGKRFSGFFEVSNGLGMFCAIFVPFIVWRMRYAQKRIERNWALILLGLLAVSVVLTGSRGSLLAAFTAGVLAMARIDWRKLLRWTPVILGLVLLVVLSSIGGLIIEKAEKYARRESIGTLTHRTEMWREAWTVFSKKPLTGVGFGASRFILLGKRETAAAAAEIGGVAADLHSEHIVMLTELGIMGGIFLWGFMLYIFVQGVKCYRGPPGFICDSGVALFSGIVAVFMDTFVSGWLDSAGSMFCLLFWIIVVMFLACMRIMRVRMREARVLHCQNANADNNAQGDAYSASK